jgi:hypothetical protein
MAVSGIGQDQIAGLIFELRKTFRGDSAYCRGENKAVALLSGQAQTAINAPLTASLARFTYHRGVGRRTPYPQVTPTNSLLQVHTLFEQ